MAGEAGLSRGTPSYFFGSKHELYLAVLERAFAAREVATRTAFAPVVQWAEDNSGPDALQTALTDAVGDYLTFLQERSAFVGLLQREELDGGQRLAAVRGTSTAMRDAFSALRTVAPSRGLRPFEIDDAVLICVSLTFSVLALRSTFLASLGRDLDDRAARHRHVALVVSQLLHLMMRSDA